MLTAQQVGRFELRDFLGRGAIGDVYLAWDPRESREVALKIVRLKNADPDMLEAEKNGISIQKQLSGVSSQVASVYEWGEDSGFFWVAMEYVAGQDLAQVLAQGPISEERAAFIAWQLCEMLEGCHQFHADVAGRKVGVVHGDIKPENIRLQDEDRVRVLDFGIAKHLSQTRRFTKNLFGSLPYTPPERLDRGGVDFHSDLWAVGVVLYLMVAGYSPFSGDDPEEVEGKIRSGEPPRPLPMAASPVLGKIIFRSLDFDPRRRYQNAAEMKADLEAWNEDKPLPSEQPRVRPLPAEDLNATRRTSPRSPVTAPVPAAFSETRRTDRPAEAPREMGPEATRRTGEVPVVIPPPPPAAAPMPSVLPMSESFPEPPPAPPPARRRLPIKMSALVGLLAAVILVGSQMWVRSEAAELHHDLATQASPDLDQMWDRYQRISSFALPGMGMGEVRTELREALLKSANPILESYHGDSPSTTERGWQRAHERLKAAVDLNFRDRATRAKMIYTRGHLNRIDSQTLKNKGQRDEARQKVRDAIGEFRDAARMAPDWPDPYLGLARVYAYEQFNLGELEKALKELERRGYPLGRRERAMLADGYRMRGQELHAQAARVRERDEQIGYLESARDYYTQAIAMYGEVGSFANARANRAATEKQLDEALSRLWDLGVF
ncbi:MAG TPA: serine/threonine-protein kinase [Thermoanaerobaculia bacterium]|nr:serine/threonine-protein kinase [Thermoanaerobaculia bacterium]